MFKFLGSVRKEMQAVTWPTGKKLRKDVMTVISTTVLFGIFFGVVDFLINTAISFFIKG